MLDTLYTYKLFNVQVIDGDTIKADINVGFDIVLKNRKIRLAGINAPETSKTIKGAPNLKLSEGIKSKEIVASALMALSTTILFKSLEKEDVFGRCLGIVFFLDKDNNFVNLNDFLFTQGYADKYKLK